MSIHFVCSYTCGCVKYNYYGRIKTMLEATTVRTTASRLDGGVRHFVHRSARSWSGSVLKPRVNKLWRRLAGERTSEQATGQLTNLPNVTPTTEAGLRPSRVGSGFCSCLSLSFPLLSFPSRLLPPGHVHLKIIRDHYL